VADFVEKVEKLEISCENTEQQALADSHIPNRVCRRRLLVLRETV